MTNNNHPITPPELQLMTNKNYFKQRVPRFIDPRLTRNDFEFTETQELLRHPYIQYWLNLNPPSRVVKYRNNVIIEEKEGFSWWVVGSVLNPDDLEVPQWNGAKYIVEYEDGKVEVLTKKSKNPVVMTCGNKATLKDGTKCKKIDYEEWKR